MSKIVLTIGAVVAAFAVLIIGLVISSLKKLDSDEVGLKYNTFEKILGNNSMYEGLHMGPPGFTFVTFPSVFRTLKFNKLRCLNIDGVTIEISVSFQFRVGPATLRRNIMQFKSYENYVNLLHHQGASAIHESCSRFNTSQFQSERGKFQEHLGDGLTKKYTGVGCEITDVQVNDIARPWKYEKVIQDKESAREDIEVAGNENPRKLTEANTVMMKAKTEAKIILDKANSDARIILNRATGAASGIFNEYKKEAETYKTLISRDGLGLNTEGFLAYLGVRTIADAKNAVNVGMKAPANPSYLKTKP